MQAAEATSMKKNPDALPSECPTLINEPELRIMKIKTRKTLSASAWALSGLTSLMMCLSALGQYSAPSTSPISIKDATAQGPTAALPYPSIIDLTSAGLTGAVEKVTVSVTLTHDYPHDVGLLLVAPNGKGVVLMNHAGGGFPVKGMSLTFDDAGIALGEWTGLNSTTYAPADLSGANFLTAGQSDPPPAKANWVTLTALAQSLSDPAVVNGKWRLYVQDSAQLAEGSISSWSVNLYTTPLLGLAKNTITVTENASASTVNFTVQDSSPPAKFTVTTAGPDALKLVKVDSSMTGLNGVLTLTPIKNQFGTGKLTITVDDGYAQSSADLTVTVTHVNQAPTIVITNTSVALVQGEMSALLTAMVDDVDNSPDQLTVTVTSDKADIISPDGVFLNPADLGSLPRNFVIVPTATRLGPRP
jgi:subtilisin-like proprotein convertase family protein